MHAHVHFDKWNKPNLKLPWIPLEKEVDALIAGSSQKVAIFLQLLKETGVRCGEARKLEWTDIDTERRAVTVNEPEKRSLPRQLKISGKLIAMLNALPKKGNKIFGNSALQTHRKNFTLQRNRIAKKLENPRPVIKRLTVA